MTTNRTKKKTTDNRQAFLTSKKTQDDIKTVHNNLIKTEDLFIRKKWYKGGFFESHLLSFRHPDYILKISDSNGNHSQVFGRKLNEKSSIYGSLSSKERGWYRVAFIQHTGEVEYEVFRPDIKDQVFNNRAGVPTLNTCQHFTPLQPHPHDHYFVNAFVEYLKLLFPIKEQRDHFIQYLAHMIQRPEQRPSTHWIIRGETGTGKDTLIDQILKPLLIHTRTITLDTLTKDFINPMYENILLVINEAKERKDKLFQKLKHLTTTEEIHINQKYELPFKQQVFSRFFVFSNYHIPLYPDQHVEERRFIVPDYIYYFKNRATHIAKIQAFRIYIDKNKDRALSAIYHYLNNHEIKINLYDAPDWDSKKIFIDSCKSPHMAEISQYCVDHPKHISLSLIKDYLELKYNREANSMIKDALLAKGYVFKTKHSKDGKCYRNVFIR